MLFYLVWNLLETYIYSDLAAQGFETKSREHAPAPPPPFTDRKKSRKRSTFCSKRPPHKNPGYGPE